MSKTPTVFLSYCWANHAEAEEIYNDLKQIGILLKKDNHEISYKDDLKSFMRSIRDTDYSILLISKDYLQSLNCMYEVTHLLKEKNVQKKILPVIIDDTSIFKPLDRIAYIKYWEQEKKNLQGQLIKIDPLNALDVYADLKLINEASQSIDNFITFITSMLIVKYSELRPTNYSHLLKAMGIEDVKYLTDLIAVVQTKSVEKRELLLDEYITKFPPNTFYHTSKAVTCTMAGKFEQAKLNYLQAIKLKSDNYEALNNLGMLYKDVFNNVAKAQECFEKAIKVEPKLTIARLNLAVLRSQYFKDLKSAKFQYERILSYDPKEPRAHNNLGNYYRDIVGKTEDHEKAEFHFKKAIEFDPDYLEAHMNYANFLKLNGRMNEGNSLYRKALELDKDGKFAEVIKTMLNSVKG
ncbi:toll/interleukin-1 receptor domain-containing protein [Pedobacter roseus]|uniref:TIR domain-containing protein n=1 Tax=Pedobacter roseus TaxID=336820 RepID=A0A7G9QMB1_9SPHI|nr:TIR domain-containing protein [Pedobacter roseus]QNN44486.1 TIR domain-containing protein [Pedobacter roseus]